jgi:hypothetical protein
LSKLNSIHARIDDASQANNLQPTLDLKSWQKMDVKRFDLQPLKTKPKRKASR